MVYMYHSFLNHSSADGPLGCLHVLAIVNGAAISNRGHVSFEIMVFSRCMPGMELLGHVVVFLMMTVLTGVR